MGGYTTNTPAMVMFSLAAFSHLGVRLVVRIVFFQCLLPVLAWRWATRTHRHVATSLNEPAIMDTSTPRLSPRWLVDAVRSSRLQNSIRDLTVKRLSTNQQITMALEHAFDNLWRIPQWFWCAPRWFWRTAMRRSHQLGLVWIYADYLLDRYAVHSPWCVLRKVVPNHGHISYSYSGNQARAEFGRGLLLGFARGSLGEGYEESHGCQSDGVQGRPGGLTILPEAQNALSVAVSPLTVSSHEQLLLVPGHHDKKPASSPPRTPGSRMAMGLAATHVSQIDEVVEASFPREVGLSQHTITSSRGQVEIEHDPTSGKVRIIYSRGAPAEHAAVQTAVQPPLCRYSQPGGNYTAVRAAIGASLAAPGDFDDGLFGPVLVRLAWHCCATYDRATDTGGSNGLTMRLVPEITDDGNTGLHTARAVLQPIKQQFPWITYADLWTLAGVVAVESMGGPRVPWTPGRVDCCDDQYVPPNGRLPLGYKDAAYIRAKFDALCLDDQGIVAMMGAHALGRCHKEYSGWEGTWTRTPTMFSNRFFQMLLEEEWSEGTVPETGRTQFYNKDKLLMMLNTDMELVRDAGFRRWVEVYAADEQQFFEDFSQAFGQLLELGVCRGADGIARDKK